MVLLSTDVESAMAEKLSTTFLRAKKKIQKHAEWDLNFTIESKNEHSADGYDECKETYEYYEMYEKYLKNRMIPRLEKLTEK
ncbi:MAG: hypothetical protein U9N57_01100 [Pseudomonadota bacterium]|nr:hypothetical protein [Pseudomonadota bacterium]